MRSAKMRLYPGARPSAAQFHVCQMLYELRTIRPGLARYESGARTTHYKKPLGQFFKTHNA